MRKDQYIKVWVGKPYWSNGRWSAFISESAPPGKGEYYVAYIEIPPEILEEYKGKLETVVETNKDQYET